MSWHCIKLIYGEMTKHTVEKPIIPKKAKMGVNALILIFGPFVIFVFVAVVSPGLPLLQ